MRLYLGLCASLLLAACSDGEHRPGAACDTNCEDAEAPRDGSAPPRDARTQDGDEPDSQPDAAVDHDADAPVDLGPGNVVSEPQDDADYVFDQAEVRTYNIVIAPADLAMINANPAGEQYVNASLEFEGQTYGPLGVRYKGSIGAFLSPCTSAITVDQTPGAKTGKCSMKIDFNRVDPAQRFHGLKQLNLHAMGQDPSQLRERLGYALFREAGVAAPRTAHARVLINGVLEGLFIAVEQIDGRFTKSRFSEGGDGNLYKEVWPQYDDPARYQAALETNESTPVVDKMLAFKHAIDRGVDGMRGYLDMDYVFRYLAADRVMTNDDGAMHWYCQGSFGPAEPYWNHNFYWYEAEHAQRLWIIPWDLDSAFMNGSFVEISPAWNTPGTCACSGLPAQRPARCDKLIDQWASLDAEYQSAVDAFLAGPFASANVDAKLNAWSAQITAATAEAQGRNGAPLAFNWQLAVGNLRSIVAGLRAARGRP